MGILKRKSLIDKLIDFDAADHVKLIKGIRLSGKTTLIKAIMEELKNRGVDEKNIVYISFDYGKNQLEDERKTYLAIKDRLEGLEGKVYLFFDDVEQYEQWQFVVDAFRKNPDIDVYVAVNYSKFYSSSYKNHLSGRCFKFELYPFSFREFVDYNKEFGDEAKSNGELFRQYLRFGGMPEVVRFKNDSDKYWSLESTYRMVKYYDLIKSLDCESFLVEEFLSYMLDTFAEKFSKEKINEYLYDMFDEDTIYPCLGKLRDSSLMAVSHSVYDSRRFLRDEKYYLIDHGFYMQENRFYPIPVADVIKNIIFIELLRRGYRVFFTEKKEKYVDFICSDYKKSIYIQFDYIFANENVIKKEIEFLKYHAGNRDKYIITTGDYDFSEYGVKHINVIDFLLGDEI